MNFKRNLWMSKWTSGFTKNNISSQSLSSKVLKRQVGREGVFILDG